MEGIKNIFLTKGFNIKGYRLFFEEMKRPFIGKEALVIAGNLIKHINAVSSIKQLRLYSFMCENANIFTEDGIGYFVFEGVLHLAATNFCIRVKIKIQIFAEKFGDIVVHFDNYNESDVPDVDLFREILTLSLKYKSIREFTKNCESRNYISDLIGKEVNGVVLEEFKALDYDINTKEPINT